MPGKRREPGSYYIHGTEKKTAEEKLTAREKQRRATNRELRTPKCMRCTRPRESRVGLLCARCKAET